MPIKNRKYTINIMKERIPLGYGPLKGKA